MADVTDLAGNNPILQAALAHVAGGGSISVQGPQAPGPAIPMAPPPPPPPMNFTDFATRPENGMAIQGALSTKPNQPTPFNHPPAAAAPSIFNPQGENMLALSSPSAAPPPFTPPAQSPLSGESAPAMPSLPSTPSSVDVVPTQQEYFSQNPNQQQTPVGQGGLSRALYLAAAGLSGAAGGLHGDPGAGLRYAEEVQQSNAGIPAANASIYENAVIKPRQQALTNQETQARIGSQEAETRLHDAQAAQVPLTAADKKQASHSRIIADAAKRGQKVDFDEDGNPTFTDDPDSEAFKQKDAAIKYAQSHQELAAAQAEYEKQKGNPNSPAYQIAAGRLAVARQNANTASAALGLHAQQFGFEQDKFYNPQPTALQRGKGDLANSSLDRIKEMRQIVAKRPDIFGPSKGRATNAQAWLGSQDPDAQTYISAANYLAEHSAGTFGGRGKYIIEQLHSLTDPHSNPAALNAALDEAERAAQGFSDAGKLHGRPNSSSPLSGNGGGGSKPGDAPPISTLKEGVAHTFANGQMWTLKDGKATRLK